MARGVFRALVLAAVLAVLVASVVNWLWLTQYGPVKRSVRTVLSGELAGSFESLPPSRGGAAALTKVPPTILSYETIARHEVPGQGKRQAEAIYNTLNMNLEAQIPMTVYVRVELFDTSTQAQQRASEIMLQYPLRQEGVRIGPQTPGTSGYTADEGARATVWSRDTYVTTVKALFSEKVPVEKRDFLRVLSEPVVDAVDIYQRTGKSGVEAAGVQ